MSEFRHLEPSQFPQYLRDRARWVCWFTNKSTNGKIKKMAVRPARALQINDERLDFTNKNNWSDLQTALACFESNQRIIRGVGFVFDENCRLVDLDGCVENGEINPQASELVSLLDSYTELSQSGRGLHILLSAYWNSGCRIVEPFPLEVYGFPRWVAFTGHHLTSTPQEVMPRDGEMLLIEKTFFKKREVEMPPVVFSKASSFRQAEGVGDDDLLKRIFRWKKGSRYQLLFQGDVVGAGYMQGDKPDHSRADMALLQVLFFATRGDEARTIRLFERSGLYRPERWHRKATASGMTYGQLTLSKLKI